jgi:hypothetical protein
MSQIMPFATSFFVLSDVGLERVQVALTVLLNPVRPIDGSVSGRLALTTSRSKTGEASMKPSSYPFAGAS